MCFTLWKSHKYFLINVWYICNSFLMALQLPPNQMRVYRDRCNRTSQASCSDLPVGYQCLCPPELQLAPDGVTCQGINSQIFFLSFLFFFFFFLLLVKIIFPWIFFSGLKEKIKCTKTWKDVLKLNLTLPFILNSRKGKSTMILGAGEMNSPFQNVHRHEISYEHTYIL